MDAPLAMATTTGSAMLSTVTERPPEQKRAKRSVACNYCRAKKVRCRGGQPCSYCVERGEECVYLALRRRRRKSYLEENTSMKCRLSRMEEALRQANVYVPAEPSPPKTYPAEARVHRPSSNSPQSQLDEEHEPSRVNQLPPSPHRTASVSPRGLWISETCNDGGYASEIRITPTTQDTYKDLTVGLDKDTSSQQSHEQFNLSVHNNNQLQTFNTATISIAGEPPQLRTPANSLPEKGTSSIAPPENSYWEYHGPGSFLSICSTPGIEWISEKTGVNDFSEVAATFTRDITRPLKLERRMSLERAPEPDIKTAWRYVKVYFEENPESAFDIVFRASFEARLRTHFQHASNPSYDDDPAWYALRNVVYASGCRIEVGKTVSAASFQESHIQGWRYFENALSMHTDLLYCRTGLMAVQALLAMAFYVEGVGCASLEYMLCSSAMRLAQSKGLHRQPGAAWGMSELEIEQRNMIFWMLYTYEKHVASRSGRPSAIEDDDISCHLPTAIPPGSPSSLEFCTMAIKHAQISSQISKKLGTVRSYRESLEDIVTVACNLNQQLEDWRSQLQPYIKQIGVIDLSELPPNLSITHAMYLQYSYWGSLIALHSTFTYPWSDMLSKDQAPSFQEQVKISTKVVAEASRNVILATKYINPDVRSPVWLAFYFPVIGLINLFVHVLKYPTLPTTQSDVVLMDVVAGYFARLEFASSGQLAFGFVRELSQMARKAVKKAQQRVQLENNYARAAVPTDNNINSQQHDSRTMGTENIVIMDELENTDISDFDMENWSALLPSFTQEELMKMDDLQVDEGLNFSQHNYSNL